MEHPGNDITGVLGSGDMGAIHNGNHVGVSSQLACFPTLKASSDLNIKTNTVDDHVAADNAWHYPQRLPVLSNRSPCPESKRPLC